MLLTSPSWALLSQIYRGRSESSLLGSRTGQEEELGYDPGLGTLPARPPAAAGLRLLLPSSGTLEDWESHWACPSQAVSAAGLSLLQLHGYPLRGPSGGAGGRSRPGLTALRSPRVHSWRALYVLRGSLSTFKPLAGSAWVPSTHPSRNQQEATGRPRLGSRGGNLPRLLSVSTSLTLLVMP